MNACATLAGALCLSLLLLSANPLQAQPRHPAASTMYPAVQQLTGADGTLVFRTKGAMPRPPTKWPLAPTWPTSLAVQ